MQVVIVFKKSNFLSRIDINVGCDFFEASLRPFLLHVEGVVSGWRPAEVFQSGGLASVRSVVQPRTVVVDDQDGFVLADLSDFESLGVLLCASCASKPLDAGQQTVVFFREIASDLKDFA